MFSLGWNHFLSAFWWLILILQFTTYRTLSEKGADRKEIKLLCVLKSSVDDVKAGLLLYLVIYLFITYIIITILWWESNSRSSCKQSSTLPTRLPGHQKLCPIKSSLNILLGFLKSITRLNRWQESWIERGGLLRVSCYDKKFETIEHLLCNSPALSMNRNPGRRFFDVRSQYLGSAAHNCETELTALSLLFPLSNLTKLFVFQLYV